MLTYDFENVVGTLYEYVYRCLKEDIVSGILRPNEKLPSKRAFANHNGISTITIQNAYDQLISEGYVYTLPRKGYYVANIDEIASISKKTKVSYDIKVPKQAKPYDIDLSNNSVNPDNFPFSVWTRVLRDVMSNREKELMQMSPTGGIWELRAAIAEHLKSFRGMLVDPNQIVIGAGTEYLYGLLIQLLGTNKTYTIENPGYKKLVQIYAQYDIKSRFASMDDQGVTITGLQDSKTDIAHICPNHHFPTGITMPASRRYEVLAWASEKSGRYVIEDDYDSEFRTSGKPIPTLLSIDGCEKVIYMNTFSKSLAPTIRISYMVLPIHLANRFYETLLFYSCTVSNFEQYTLAQFIDQGYYEKHINRMRLFYMRQRKRVIEIIEKSRLGRHCEIMENDSGLHFLLRLHTHVGDVEVGKRLRENKIQMRALSEYDLTADKKREHMYIINYSNIDVSKMDEACAKIYQCLW